MRVRSPPELHLDFPYTERDTPEIRARIDADLAAIARIAHAEDPALRALVLTGGFSRGEGSVRDGAPINDYDLVAVRRVPGGHARYARIGEAATRAVGLEVDLLPVWDRRLPFVGRKIFWLDVRLGGRVASGDPRALRGLRAFGPERVTSAEIARLLGNRAAGLLLSLPEPGEPVDGPQRDLQATKAILAAMDATLLHRGVYAASLRDRLALARGHPDHALFSAAVEWKLKPHHGLPLTWWERARDALLRAVATTNAREAPDGPVEQMVHLLKARRVALSPSQQVRRVAWDLLSISTFPDGPADLPGATTMMRRLGAAPPASGTWAAVKAGFFTARKRTLQ